MIIDEIQRVPDLLSYIQAIVDEERSGRGRFILTGSQQVGLRATVSQSPAGRVGQVVNMSDLSNSTGTSTSSTAIS